MKGIILAAGNGTRLHPASHPISKILLPVYDKPMIYYPLSTLMLAGIKDIMIITNKKDQENFIRTLGDGSGFGIKISYAVQSIQRGIADAFIIAEDFIAGDNVVLILGDNIFHGKGMKELMEEAAKIKSGAKVFVHKVHDPERFGVAELDKNGNVISLEEKPKKPRSNYAVTGLYFYGGDVCGLVKGLKLSERGELEITDLNRMYLAQGSLKACVMKNGYRWMDAGTFDSLHDAQTAIRDIQKKEGKKVACLEEIAIEQGFVTTSEMRETIKNESSEYYEYVRKRIDELSQ